MEIYISVCKDGSRKSVKQVLKKVQIRDSKDDKSAKPKADKEKDGDCKKEEFM